MTKKMIKKIGQVLFGIVLALLVLLVLFTVYCNANQKVAYVGGYATVRIISGSMETTIPTNSYILVKKIDADAVQENDVIIFRSSDPSIFGKLNTHRVIGISSEGGNRTFTTKGDNNKITDQYTVKADDVSGVYVKNLTLLTKISIFLSKPWAFIIFIILPALALLVLAGNDVRKGIANAKHEALVEEEIKRLQETQNLNQKGVEVESDVQENKTEKTD